MTLARSWIRPLLGASAGALIAPLALLLSVLLLGVGGGLSGLQSLGQLLTGPAAPSPLRVSLVTPRRVELAPTTRRAPAAARPLAAARPAAPARPPLRRGASHTAPRAPGRGGPMAGFAPPRPFAPPLSSPSGQVTKQVAPPSSPTPVDQLAQTGQAVAQKLPAPVGPAAGQAISTVASAVDHVLPPAPWPAGAPSPAPSGSTTSLPRLP